jgi:two-component system response regulator CpxR
MRPKKLILLVDGNEQSLSVRKFMLQTRGYRVAEAVNAVEALERFAQGGIDLVLSDLLLPGMDGNEMVRRMKQESPEVPALLVSGTVREFARADAADAFLPKGAGPSGLWPPRPRPRMALAAWPTPRTPERRACRIGG